MFIDLCRELATADYLLEKAEDLMTIRNLELAEVANCSIHIAHVSTVGSTDIIRKYKKEGIKVVGYVSTGLNHEACNRHPEWSRVNGEGQVIYGDRTGNFFRTQCFNTGYTEHILGILQEVLDILQEYNIKGLFFLCGNYLSQQDLILRMQNEGHQLGNHTNKHRDLPSLNEDGIRQDITSIQLPGKVKFFRPPQGRFDAKTLRVAREAGLRAVLWSLAIADWQKSPKLDVDACTQKILDRVHPGAIMLFHITNPGTPEMLRALIPALQNKGYTFGELV